MIRRKLLCALSIISLLVLSSVSVPIGADPGVGWGTAAIIGSPSSDTDTEGPEIAVDRADNAYAVWRDGNEVYANRRVGGVWGTPVDIHAALLTPCLNEPQVAAGASDKAIVVWIESRWNPDLGLAVRVVCFSAWTGMLWLPGVLNPGSIAHSYSPDVAASVNGNAIVVWTSGTEISACSFTWPSTVSSATIIGSGTKPQVAMDDEGNAIAVWLDGDSVKCNRYAPASGWGTESLVAGDTIIADTYSNPQIAMNSATGDAIVTFEYNAFMILPFSDCPTVCASVYDGTSWSSSVAISSGDMTCDNSTIAADRYGNAIAVWEYDDGTDTDTWGNVYNPDRGGWGVALELVSGKAINPRVAMGGEGYAMLVCEDYAMVSVYPFIKYNWQITARAYTPAAGWLSVNYIDSLGDPAMTPCVAAESDGNAVAAWRQGEDVWSNYYERDVTDPTADAGEDQYVRSETVVTFDGRESTDDDGVTNYTWTFDDVAAKTLYGATPTYKFGNVGVFTVTLTVRDEAWNSDTDTMTVTVEDTPPVAEAGDDQFAKPGTDVELDGTESTDNFGIATYKWTFDDGGPQTILGPVVTYLFNNPGVFTVTLNVTDRVGLYDTDECTITVEEEPPSAEAGPDQLVAVGSVVTFDGSDSTDNVGVANYTWNFTDGSPVVLWEVSPTYQFDNGGVFEVTLNASDAAGNWDTDTVLITVDEDGPTADAGPDQDVLTGDTVTFDGTGSTDNMEVVNWTWTLSDDGDKTLYEAEPTYVFEDAGDFVVTLTVRDGAGLSDTDTVTISVDWSDTEDPVADAGDDQSVLTGDTVTFDGSGSSDNIAVVNWTWTFEDDGDKTLYGETATYVFDAEGAYTVVLTVRDVAGLTDTDTVTIDVAVPDATSPIADAGDDLTVDVGAVVEFDGSGSSDDVGVVSYSWSFEYDGETRYLTGVSPSFTFEIAGEYTVTLTVEDAAGNSATDTVVITVEEEGVSALTIALVIGIVAIAAIAVALLLLKRRKGVGPPEAPPPE